MNKLTRCIKNTKFITRCQVASTDESSRNTYIKSHWLLIAFMLVCFMFICLYYHDLIVFFIIQVATGIANLSDLRAIHGALVIYKKILSHLHDSHFDVNLQPIDNLLMEDFSLLDGLYNELDTAVGQIISEHSVMEGYSNTADEIKERLNENTRQVEQLRDIYR